MSTATPGDQPQGYRDAPLRPLAIDPRREAPVRVILERPGVLRKLFWAGMTVAIWLFVGVIGLSALLLFAGVIAASRNSTESHPRLDEKFHSLSPGGGDKVAIIDVEGLIVEADGYVKWQIEQAQEDEKVKAVVLRVNSPGGTISGSDYIYHHLKRLLEKRQIPLVVSMGGMAASGGYYVSMAVGDQPDSIFAEPSTWTGSIGVIIPHYDLTGLMDKWSITDDSVVSNPLKQTGSLTKKFTGELGEKERKILQTLVDESFQDFKDIVKSGRPAFQKDPAALDALATGQVYTAKQALNLKLVDKLGFLEDAIDRTIELTGLDKANVRVVRYAKPHTTLGALLGSEAIQTRRGASLDLSGLLDLAAPRAYYLCTLLPGITVSQP